MSIKDDVALLKTVPLFSKVDTSQLNVLAFSLEHMNLEAGEILFRDGDNGDGAFLIVEGSVTLMRRVSSSEVSIKAERGTLIGEQSMFAPVPYRGSAKADVRSKVLKISRDLFYKVAEEFPDLAVEAVKTVNEKLNSTLADLHQVQRDL